MARLEDGRPVFVTGALPGDELDLGPLAEKKGYARALSWDLRTPSTDRRAAPCAVANECGGCDLMSLSADAQTRAKLQLLQQALARTGGIHELPNEIELITAGTSLAYRSRVRLHLVSGNVGFFARGSRRLVTFDECVVCSPALSAAVARFRQRVSTAPAAFQCFGEAEVRAFEPSDLTEVTKPSLCLYVTDGIRGVPPDAREQLQVLEKEFQVAVVQLRRGREHLIIKSEQVAEVCPGENSRMRLGVNAFSQVNWSVNQRLVADLIEGVQARRLSSFLDLYCGAGNFSLPLLRAGLSGVGVEGSSVSVQFARKSAKAQGLNGGRFLKSDVEPAVARLLAEAPRFELALLDPPRAGAKRVLPGLCKLKPKTIFMCSCDPVTFARDLKTLIAAGYDLEQLQAYDMFPQTHHLEAVAWLSRRPGVTPHS